MLIIDVIKGPHQGQQFTFQDRRKLLIGRSSKQVQLRDATISRQHAELVPMRDEWHIRDLGSFNGTFVNGTRIEESVKLQEGDQIRVGATLFVVGYGDAREATGLNRDDPAELVKVASDGEVDVAIKSSHAAMSPPVDLESAATQSRLSIELQHQLGAMLDRRRLAQRLMRLIFTYFEPHRGVLLLGTSPGAPSEPIAVRFWDRPPAIEDQPVLVPQRLMESSTKECGATIAAITLPEHRLAESVEQRMHGMRHALCTTIAAAENRFGLLFLDRPRSEGAFTEAQASWLATVGVQIGLILANHEAVRHRIERIQLETLGNAARLYRAPLDKMERMFRKAPPPEFDDMQAQTRNMLALVGDDKRVQAAYDPVDVVWNQVERLRPTFDQCGVALIADLEADDVPMLNGYADDIGTAVVNVLLNALAAVEPGNGVVTLKLDVDTSGVTISVADNGPGVRENKIEQLFRPFYTTHSSTSLGLGLTAARRIVEHHHGKCDFESEFTKGSTVTIRLPYGIGGDSFETGAFEAID